MINLHKALQEFVLSEDSRCKILDGSAIAPVEFVCIAQTALSGHFLVNGRYKDIVVRPTSIEFYYHEEQEGGIKDYIVYHKNSGNHRYLPFLMGVLHNHASGIDISFESGDAPEKAVRASMLIREFDIDGENEDRSTLLYEALYQQSSLFDGISVKWVDGEDVVNVTTYPRKNVALYDSNACKMSAKDYPDMPATDDRKYVQDPRCWQFRRSLINDKDTNKVYISAWLKKECPEFYARFINLLKENGIPCIELMNTADIWARDYMPVQVYDDLFIQYCYNPDYLQSKRDKVYITDTDAVCNKLGLQTKKSNLVIDGGNVVKVGKYVILTEKVYVENASLKPAEIRTQIKRLFHAEPIMLPWDKREKYGHADGIVKAIDDNSVLLTNYGDYDPQMAVRFEKILSQYLKVKKLEYTQKTSDSNWAYINFLRVGNTIILPGLGIAEDTQALKQIQTFYPDCKVLQIECSEVVAKGGALNCITWNIK